MFYFPLKNMAKIAIGVNFKNIYFSNFERIPMDKPVLLVTNHPSAFIEPCIFGAYLTRNVNWLVRGDMFKKPIFRKFMEDINLIPIYRSIDGFDSIKNNYGTMEYVHELLSKGEMVHILAEGSTAQVKKPRPLKKGFARMAFGTLDEYSKDIDIHILPCGINYTQADKFRSEVMVAIGQPVRIQDYLEEYEKNGAKAIRTLTSDMEEAMKHLIITIGKEDKSACYEQIFEMHRNNRLRPIFPIYDTTNNQRFEQEFLVAEKLNNLPDNNLDALAQKSALYFSKLNDAGLNDFGVRNKTFGNIGKVLVLIFGFVPFLVGKIGAYIPGFIAKKLAETKIKQLEFKAPVAIAGSIAFYFIAFVIMVIIGIFIAKWWFWVLLLLIPFLGLYALIYQEYFAHWWSAIKFKRAPKVLQEELIKLREDILRQASSETKNHIHK